MSDQTIPPSDNPYRSPTTPGGFPGGASPVTATIVGASGKDVFMWAMFCHLASLAGFVIPFGNIVGPVVVWLIKRETHPFIDQHGKESLNFQISVTIYEFVALALMLLALFASEAFFLVVLFIGCTWLMGLLTIIYSVFAAVTANKGQPFLYPFTIRFLK